MWEGLRGGWELVMKCLCMCMCVCALGQMSVFYLSVCTVLMWITILALPLLRILP